MAPSDQPETDDSLAPTGDAGDDQASQALAAAEQEEEARELDLSVVIDEPSTCERHVTVTVSREDIDWYYNKEFSELMDTAQVPGFRTGHAPRKLVEARFRKDVTDKVKSELLLDSIAQVSEKEELSAISEPDMDVDAVEVPAEGPMTFEFDLEVRPRFDLPQWKGLTIEKPVREFGDKDVDRMLERLLSEYGQLVPHDGPAELGDYVTCNLTFKHGDEVLSSATEEVIRIRPELSFRDGSVKDFDKLLQGVTAGETREGQADLTDDAPNQALRGQAIKAIFEILEVKKLNLPELTPEFLDEMGGFESEAELRDLVRDNLVRQLEYQQHQRAREQDHGRADRGRRLGPASELLKRQSERELSRAVMELRRSGFGDDEIRAFENQLRQNSQQSTARALKEHFILERIAEDEEIEDAPEDYDDEIALIARQSGETARRVRARLEKGGGMDVLRNQIIERKVIDLILSQAEFEEVPYEPEEVRAEALDRSAGGGEPESDIPEAKPEKAASEPSTEEPEESSE